MAATLWCIVRAALRDIWNDLVTTSLCNLLWLVFNLTVVAGPPATLALFYVAHRLAHGEATDLGDFMHALRRYFGLGWKWGLVCFALAFVLAGDVVLTGRLSQSAAARWIQGGFAAALAAWLFLQLYALPFLFEQETPAVRQALRNGAVMLGGNLVFSVGLGIALAVLLLAGVVLSCVTLAIGGILVALMANYAVLDRLEAWRAIRCGGTR